MRGDPARLVRRCTGLESDGTGECGEIYRQSGSVAGQDRACEDEYSDRDGRDDRDEAGDEHRGSPLIANPSTRHRHRSRARP
ncbi:MAG: hypothetical protein L0H25_10730 [Micrococcales bacterium]|nr:hypothetical protein [Micrococcales bacterium]